jgi:TM2 domain-containing membrane protein YozV
VGLSRRIAHRSTRLDAYRRRNRGFSDPRVRRRGCGDHPRVRRRLCALDPIRHRALASVAPLIPPLPDRLMPLVTCPECDRQISDRAASCPHCGYPLRQPAPARAVATRGPAKSRGVAVILALFLGGLGFHKFYLGRMGWGFMYLLFFWTFIPAILGILEAHRLPVHGRAGIPGEVQLIATAPCIPRLPPPPWPSSPALTAERTSRTQPRLPSLRLSAAGSCARRVLTGTRPNRLRPRTRPVPAACC